MRRGSHPRLFYFLRAKPLQRQFNETASRSVYHFMKSLLLGGVVLFAIIACVAGAGDTNQPAAGNAPYPVVAIVSSNTITFPVLLSKKTEPLMTNAVFHRTFGRKVIFGEALSVKAFDVDQLHPSVLAQLDLDANQLKADQQAIDARYQQWAAQFHQRLQQLLTIETSSTVESASAEDSTASINSATANTNKPPHVRRYWYTHHAVHHTPAPKATERAN